jgi:hypothetical protein
VATLSGRTRGTLGPREHWHLKRDGRFRSTARENPTSDAWWIVGMLAGAGALIAGIAYASRSSGGGAAPGPTSGPTSGPTIPTVLPTAPPTILVPGGSYSLVITCSVPVPSPDLAPLGAFGAVTNVSVLPANQPPGTLLPSWTINFTYVGTNPVPVPAFFFPAGCNAVLYPQTVGLTLPPPPTTVPTVAPTPFPTMVQVTTPPLQTMVPVPTTTPAPTTPTQMPTTPSPTTPTPTTPTQMPTTPASTTPTASTTPPTQTLNPIIFGKR